MELDFGRQLIQESVEDASTMIPLWAHFDVTPPRRKLNSAVRNTIVKKAYIKTRVPSAEIRFYS